ncbi:MAG: dienelactone hydrolase family protein [Alphaproteobacteria bacterium]
MGEWIKLKARDGHGFDAYKATPSGKPRGGLVVIQEIFGVNDNIRGYCDRFAAAGYVALAPALFDRDKPGIELGYTAETVAEGRDIRARVGWDGPIMDVEASLAALKKDVAKVGVTGYCWGGSLAWVAACRFKPACAVGYYGGQIIQFVDETPDCPVILHFGALDKNIPLSDVETIRAKHPDVPIHVYQEAGHGFDCEARGDFHPASSQLARERSSAFFKQHLG